MKKNLSMHNIIKSGVILLQAVILTGFSFQAKGQSAAVSSQSSSADSLTLETIIETIIKQHPTVKSAEEALKNADAKIGLAKTGYYPTVDMSASYSNMGPVVTLNIPDMGTFQLYPNNNYAAAINYHQVLYDFGRTRQNMEIETESKVISEQALEQTKQKMSLAAVNNFYTLAFLQEAAGIKDEELATLQSHLKYIETMKVTGSATDYQVLSTQVKISSVESQKADIQAALTIQQSYLNSLLGADAGNIPVVRKELNVQAPLTESDSLFSYAYKNRNEMLLVQSKAMMSGMRYEFIKTLNKPIVSLIASGGAKNGYVPNLDQIRPNYIVGIGLSVPIFDGMKTKYNLQQAQSAINSVAFETENAKRNITSEVKEAEAYMNSAKQKVLQFELQTEQALKAYSLAITSFKSGMITNLELLDSDTAVSESKLMLLKARIDYAASIYKLKAALGEKLY
jgi:outer membrane protein